MGNLRKLVGAKRPVTRLVAVDGSGDFETIQDAIDDLPTGGGVVYIKEGTYTITSSITITSSNVSLIGTGYATKIYLDDNVERNCIVIGDGSTSYENILIKDLQIDGNKANQVGTSRGIQVYTNITSSRIEGCWIHDCGGSGIFCYTSCNNVIINNQCNSNDWHGIRILSTSNNNIIANNQCNSNGRDGIHLSESSDNIIVGNICKDNDVDNTATYDGIGIHLDSNNNIISGNRCQDNDTYEINIDAATCNKNVVVGNICIGTDHVRPISDSGTGTDVSHNLTT